MISNLKKSILIIIFLNLLYPIVVFAAEQIPLKTTQLLSDPSTPFILAVEADYPPFLFVENGQTQGIAYEYTKLIAKKLNKDLQLSEPMQLQDMLDSVKTGKNNILADITKTPERSEYLEFSDSFVKTPAVFIERKDTYPTWDKSSYTGAKIAVGKGYGVVSYLKNKYPDAKYIELASDTEVINAVSLGAADLGALDTSSLSYIIQETPLSNITSVGETGFSYSLSFAVSKDNASFIPQINQAIKDISTDERTAIFNKWQSSLPNNLTPKTSNNSTFIFISIIAGILVIVFLVIAIVLRKKFKNKVLELEALNNKFTQTIKSKNKQRLDEESDQIKQSEDLEKTKKAILNILEDVQEEKNKVEQNAAKLKLATQSAKIGVWEYDIKPNIITWDDQMYALYGIQKEDFGGAYEAWQKGLHPDDKKTGDQAIQDALNGVKDFDTTFRVVWPSGEIRYIKAYAIVQRDAKGKPIKMIGVNFDVTKEKEVDLEKTEFVSLASHQLKTPVGALKWNFELLLDGDYGPLTPKQTEVISDMHDMNQRMISLITSLLNISRIEMGSLIIEPEPTDIIALCDEVILELEPRITAKQHQIIKNFEPNLPTISVDPKLLRVIYQNLLSNAVKYTQNQGKITVKLTVEKENIVISVNNNGQPIPLKDQPNIFKKLFRASNAQEQDTDGTGLGLYMVKKIIDAGGGKVWFESTPTKGTTFYVTIPLSGMIKKTGTKSLS